MDTNASGDVAKMDEIKKLFADVERNGRNSLEWEEITGLLNAVGIVCTPEKGNAKADRIGREVKIELLNSREFGPIITVGPGGIEGGLSEDPSQKAAATASASTVLADADSLFEIFSKTQTFRRLAALEPNTENSLKATFASLIDLLNAFSQPQEKAEQIIESLTIDPLVIENGTITVSSATCQIGRRKETFVPRPIAKIDKLLHPESIGIIGVSSTKMNFGRIILHNVIDSGYDKNKMRILRPGEDEIDGVKCIESLSALDQKLDLLIVAVAADAVYDLVDEIIATDSVNAVMLIPGNLGEMEKSKEPAAELAKRINQAHLNEGGGPIFLGANCLGVVSHPGNYDSWFIPLERLPKPQKKPERNSVLLSQSGAFMITRLSRNPWLDPRYMMALGNQTDLTHGDMLTYFADRPEIETIGVYIEGFKDLDGLQFAQAVRKATLNSKQVVVYKSGRTESGARGVMGHTASIAGDPALFASIVEQAGAIVTTEFTEFDDLFYIAGALHNKTIKGNRLGAISGAGFEAVGMADSTVCNGFSMVAEQLSPETVKEVEAVLEAKRLSALVEVRNPIDINPGADDEAHMKCAEAFANASNIDAVVIGLDPTAPSVRALDESKKRPGHDIHHPESTVNLMPELGKRTDKPVIGVVDGGALYDPMAAAMMDKGFCVFRTSSRAVMALTRYTEARLKADKIREKWGG